MTALRFCLLLAVSLTPVATAHAPEAQRYRLEYWNSQQFDFSVIGQPVQRVGFGYTTWLRVGVAESLPERRRLTMVVDSAHLMQGSLVPLPVESLGGASWTGLLRPDGRLDSWRAEQDRPGAGHLRTLLWQFYPRVARPLTLGSAWTDSVEHRFAEINGAVTFRIITRYRADSIEAIAGRDALRLSADILWSQTADLQFTRGTGTMNGVGHGVGRYYIAADDGLYLAGESVVVSDLILSRPGAGDVPVHDSSHTRVFLGPASDRP
jgi:hypothetical protein